MKQTKRYNSRVLNFLLYVFHRWIYILFTLSLLILLLYWVIWFIQFILGYILILVFYSILSYSRLKNKGEFDGIEKRKYIKNPLLYLVDFLKEKGYQVMVSLWWLFLICWYFNDVSPFATKQYTLYNPKTGQTIVYQWMIHVATREYYDKVKKDIFEKSSNGYVLYFEEVWSEESSKTDYEQAVAFLMADYINAKNSNKKAFSLVGDDTKNKNEIVKQANEELIFYANTAIVADTVIENINNNTQEIHLTNEKMDIKKIREESELINLAQKAIDYKTEYNIFKWKVESGEWSGGLETLRELWRDLYTIDKKMEFYSTSPEVLSQGLDVLSNILNSDNQTVAYTARWLANFAFKINIFLWEKGFVIDSRFNDRVLNYRNKILASYIMKYKDPKVYVTYGQAHFKGFFEELNKMSVEAGEGEFIIVNEKEVRAY